MLRALFGTVSRPKPAHQSEHAHNERLSIRVLTHNIRYATSSLFENEKPWEDRFPLVMNQLLYHTRFLSGAKIGDEQPLNNSRTDDSRASFICLQEVLYIQLYDVLESLNRVNESGSEFSTSLPTGPIWAHIGVAREDGRTKGEYSPILYPPRLFDLLHFENTWLSPTPDKPSKGWDAGSERILTTGIFEHKFTKTRLAMFNTHLDNVGTEAREKSVKIIIDVIERVRYEWRVGREDLVEALEGLDYILAGDFNSFSTQEAYKAIVASNKMVDTHDAVPTAERYGNEVTFTGFQPDTDVDKDAIGRIDFIWLGPKSRVRELRSPDSARSLGGWAVQGYSVLPNVFDDGIFCSDHRCVVADTILFPD